MNKKKYVPSRKINTIKNHFVPKSYLKFFENNNGTIFAYDKKIDTVYTSDKNNLGFEKNIYNAKDNLGKKSYEEFFTDFVDKFYAKTINQVISSAKLKVLVERPLSSTIIKNNLAKIIITQIFRVPDMIYSMKDNYKETLDFIEIQLNNSKELKKYSNVLKKYSDNSYYKDIILNIVTDENKIDMFSNEILSKTWLLFHNMSSLKLITSDNPIVRYNYRTGNLKNGIGRNDIFIGFPLTPEYYLAILPNDYLLGGIRLEADKCFTIGDESLKTIHFWNNLQISNCSRFVYGNL